MPSMVGIVGRALAVDEKVFFVCFFVTLWNDEVCHNGNAIKQSNFQNIMVSCEKLRFFTIF